MYKVASCVFVIFVSSWFLLAQESREIQNVEAFARLYGVVRYFYPSDAAAAADWNRFAIDGVARVRTAPDANALAAQLKTLTTPLGPGIDISTTLPAYRAPAAAAEPLVAWRYLGAGVSELPNTTYGAKRTNRARRTARGGANGFAGLMQTVPALGLRGKAVRLRGLVRATAPNTMSGGALWLRVDRSGQQPGCFDNMGDRLVRETGWREYVLQCVVADDATIVAFGVMTVGDGTSDFDGIELSAPVGGGEWRALPINDGGFEETGGTAWNRVGAPDAQVTRPSGEATEGRQFVRIAMNDRPQETVELIPDAPPAASDHVDVDLGSGLKARVALALTDSQARSATPLAPAATATADLDARLADIVVAWNVYRHFYPYLTDAGIDWDALLQPQIQRAYRATSRAEQANALKRLVADARDGHGRVNDMRQRTPPILLPLQLALLESRIVVVASRTADVPAGSVVASVDGVPATERFASAMQLVSGSTQWKQVRAAQELLTCSNGESAHLMLDSGNGTRAVDVRCASELPPVDTRPAQIAELSPGIWYVDLTRAKDADLSARIATLAAAKGVVFDVRGYPTEAGIWLLPHLIDMPETDRWMHKARVVGPFGQTVSWQDIGWNLTPATPKIAGKVVFLTDGRAISYAESVMGYIHDRHLATIVGSTTAGTNGDIASFSVPSGFQIIFTGLRVTGHDGRAVHHLAGVPPDIAVAPTLAGLKEGRDEVLTRALALMR